jgi:hypothetical protein
MEVFRKNLIAGSQRRGPMKGRLLLVAIAVIGLMLGCAVKPDPDVIGPYPNGYENIIKNHVLKTYYDPYSIRSARLSYPNQGHILFQQGWIVCLEANSKNRMGGYTGLKRTGYLIRSGLVLQVAENAQLCNDPSVYYHDAPELENIK